MPQQDYHYQPVAAALSVVLYSGKVAAPFSTIAAHFGPFR